MRVRLLLFASLKEAIGQSELCVELPSGTTTAELWPRLQTAIDLGSVTERDLGTVRIAINEEIVHGARTIVEGDTIALLPPVTGG